MTPIHQHWRIFTINTFGSIWDIWRHSIDILSGHAKTGLRWLTIGAVWGTYMGTSAWPKFIKIWTLLDYTSRLSMCCSFEWWTLGHWTIARFQWGTGGCLTQWAGGMLFKTKTYWCKRCFLGIHQLVRCPSKINSASTKSKYVYPLVNVYIAMENRHL